MPLNVTQCRALQETLKLSVDAILETPDSHAQKVKGLSAAISNAHPTPAETAILLNKSTRWDPSNLPEGYRKRINRGQKKPGLPEQSVFEGQSIKEAFKA